MARKSKKRPLGGGRLQSDADLSRQEDRLAKYPIGQDAQVTHLKRAAMTGADRCLIVGARHGG
jgi:hypothetical protein